MYDERVILKLIRMAVSRLNKKGKQVFLFFDKLDEGWQGSKTYIAFIQGLLLAIREMKALRLDLNPVAFMRDDMYEVVTHGFQHLDHLEGMTDHIRWNEPALAELVSLRIRSSLEKRAHRIPQSATVDEIWALAFESTVPAKRKAVPMVSYMIDRTLFRPRDIVLFANLALRIAVAARHSQILAEDVQEAEKKYSEVKYNHLIGELSYRYPGLDSLLERWKRKPIGWDLEDLRLFVLLAHDDLKHTLSWLPEDEKEAIKLLYTVGFLSYTTKGGYKKGTRVVHSAVNPDAADVLEKKRIYVSPIFRKGLKLKDH